VRSRPAPRPTRAFRSVPSPAHDIASNVSPLSAAVIKQLPREFAPLGDPADAVSRENQLLGWISTQPDVHEGVAP
jgi:hypothetical protein